MIDPPISKKETPEKCPDCGLPKAPDVLPVGKTTSDYCWRVAGESCLARQIAKAKIRIDELELDCSGLMVKTKEQSDEIEALRRWKGLPAEEFTRIKAERDEWEEAFRSFVRDDCPPGSLPHSSPCLENHPSERANLVCYTCWSWWLNERKAVKAIEKSKGLG